MPTRVRKAIIPAAGLGTRFLPATKVTPKELFPVFERPAIQLVVEEAVASGADEVILVVSERKQHIVDYFRPDPLLSEILTAAGKKTELEKLQRLSSICDIRVVYQNSPAGLGDAIRCARPAVGEEPFLVLLPDVLILSPLPCGKQLIQCYDRNQGCIVATREIPAHDTGRFGILSVEPTRMPDGSYRVRHAVEKPKPAIAPSRLGVFGRYVLEPAIFDYIDAVRELSQEVQLTDALARYAGERDVYAILFEGEHFDTGDRLGLIQATIELALRDRDVRDPLVEYLRSKVPGFAHTTASND